jgi:hypothetical protein
VDTTAVRALGEAAGGAGVLAAAGAVEAAGEDPTDVAAGEAETGAGVAAATCPRPPPIRLK